ncbi:MAG: ComEC family competence protein [Thermomicrobiales bacterium]|nr:ComEC family competence protein [Thermomicrobiales bacterium]
MTNGIAIGLSALAGVWLGWIALPIVLGTLLLLQALEQRYVPSLLLTCLVVAALGSLRSPQVQVSGPDPLMTASTGAIGEVVSFPRPSSSGQRLVFDISEICIGQQCIPAKGRMVVYVPEMTPPLGRGAVIRVDWRFQHVSTLSPGYRDYVIGQNAIGSARATSVTYVTSARRIPSWIAVAQHRTVATIHRFIPSDAGALATGIVTGDDSALSDGTREDFRATGTTHITAVSGQNVSLILGFLSLWYTPITPRGRLAFHALLIVVVWSYAVFVGLEPPALRAAIFATLMVTGRHVGRRPDPMTILCLTLGVMALIDPWVVRSVGYWLSAIASLALCLAMPTILSQQNTTRFWEIVRAPIIASLATMPLIMMAFGSWSPISILANILISPIMSLAFPLCYAFTLIALLLPTLAPIAAIVPTIVLNTAIDIVHQIAPWALQIRVDQLTPTAALVLWTPIALGIWLLSDECHRWLRRIAILTTRRVDG